MSALTVIQQRDAIHLISDAASYDLSGIVQGIGSKIVDLPNSGCAFVTRGSVVSAIPLKGLLHPFTSFDEIVDVLPGFISAIRTTLNILTNGEVSPSLHFEVTIAGWSDRMQRFVAGIASTFEVCDPNDPQGVSYLPGYQPAVPFFAAPAVASPTVDFSSVVGRQIESEEDVEGLDPGTDGLAILEAQRLTPSVYKSSIQYVVGGFAELVTVSRDGISRRILKEWPEDEVGRPISPRDAMPIEEVRRLFDQAGPQQTPLAA